MDATFCNRMMLAEMDGAGRAVVLRTDVYLTYRLRYHDVLESTRYVQLQCRPLPHICAPYTAGMRMPPYCYRTLALLEWLTAGRNPFITLCNRVEDGDNIYPNSVILACASMTDKEQQTSMPWPLSYWGGRNGWLTCYFPPSLLVAHLSL